MTTREENSRQGMMRLLRLARPELSLLGTGTVFLALGSAMLLLYPQVIKVIVDEALTSGRTELIDRAALLVMGVFLVQGVAGALRYYLFTLAGERTVTRLREQVYRRIMSQEIGFFDSRRTGELTSRLSSDAMVVQNTVSVNISMVLRNLAAAIGGIAMLVYTSSLLTLIMLVVVPPIGLGVALFGRTIRRLSKNVQDSLADAGVVAEETISGIRTVRAFAQEEQEGLRYRNAVQRSFGFVRLRVRSIAYFTGIASIIGYAAIVATLWYGGRMVVAKEMTVGELTSFILYTLTAAVSVGSLGGLWTDFMAASGASKRIFELLDREPLIPLRGGSRLSEVKGAVAFQSVCFSYPSRADIAVLIDVSLVVNPGEIVALVGPSGGGKSTMASLIPRFYDPKSGVVAIDGHDVKSLDGDWLHQQIGIVAQDPVLVSTTIAENIRYGDNSASKLQIENAARTANAHEFIEAFPEGYQTLVGERGIQLSGGQRQRIAIARAVLKNPRILILDEATSALDSESEYLVKEALDRLMKQRTTFVIAHRLSTVKDADRVIVIEKGHIVQSGTHQELMQDPAALYYKLVDRQLS